jgi:hypothetical protein
MRNFFVLSFQLALLSTARAFEVETALFFPSIEKRLQNRDIPLELLKFPWLTVPSRAGLNQPATKYIYR